MNWRWIPALALVTLAGGRTRDPQAFVIEPEVRTAVRALWAGSLASHTERVACLASRVEGDTLRITGIQPLEAGADSLAVSAVASLEACGPPAWQGTVHTHVALTGNHHPYAQFSGADRGIMLMWWQRWKADGTFCLLFAEGEAHCEIDGSHVVILPSLRY